MERTAERETRAAEQAKSYVRSLDELAAAGEEDNRRDNNRAVYKARNFDDWKDGHPKGAGVTKRV